MAATLPRELLSVRRRGSRIAPVYAPLDEEHLALARELIGTFEATVGERKAVFQERVRAREEEAGTAFKRVRALATLLERRCAFEMATTLDPVRARRATWEAAARLGPVVDEATRAAVLAAAAADAGATPAAVEAALEADFDENLVLVRFDAPPPEALLRALNVALTQTLLFDAVGVEIALTRGHRNVFGLVKLNGLMHTVERLPDGAFLLRLDGPASVLKQTRRYGSAIAKVLPALRHAAPWRLSATILERNPPPGPAGAEAPRERTFEVDSTALPFPARDVDAPDPDAPVFDSRVEQRFAESFRGLRNGWTLHREPALLQAGESVVIPDFGFAYGDAPPSVYLEIVGYWTPGYLRRKIGKLKRLDRDVTLLLAVDEALGVAPEAFADVPAEVVWYREDLPLAPIARALAGHAEGAVAAGAERLVAAGLPAGDVVRLDDWAAAARAGVAAADRALAALDAGGRERVGNALVAPAALAALALELTPGLPLAEAEARLAKRGLTDASSVLARLGLGVAWKGLDPSGAVLVRRS